MPGVPLSPDDEKLRERVKELLAKCRDFDRIRQMPRSKVQALFNEMALAAHDLHKRVQPKHHKHMIENRGVSPDTPEFYHHVHPVEDLLDYIEDTSANDDPEDQTIGAQFTFPVYTRRWNGVDTYQVTRTESGWDVSHISISGPCDKAGRPVLYANLDQDSVNYPEELPGYMEWLWEQAAERGLTSEEVQASLKQLADWISVCERHSPTGIFEAYK